MNQDTDPRNNKLAANPVWCKSCYAVLKGGMLVFCRGTVSFVLRTASFVFRLPLFCFTASNAHSLRLLEEATTKPTKTIKPYKCMTGSRAAHPTADELVAELVELPMRTFLDFPKCKYH